MPLWHVQQFCDRELNIYAATVVIVLACGSRKRPRAVMVACQLAVIGFCGGVLVTATKADHCNTTGTASEGVHRNDHGEQDG